MNSPPETADKRKRIRKLKRKEQLSAVALIIGCTLLFPSIFVFVLALEDKLGLRAYLTCLSFTASGAAIVALGLWTILRSHQEITHLEEIAVDGRIRALNPFIDKDSVGDLRHLCPYCKVVTDIYVARCSNCHRSLVWACFLYKAEDLVDRGWKWYLICAGLGLILIVLGTPSGLRRVGRRTFVPDPTVGLRDSGAGSLGAILIGIWVGAFTIMLILYGLIKLSHLDPNWPRPWKSDQTKGKP